MLQQSLHNGQAKELTLTLRKTQKIRLNVFRAASISPKRSYTLAGFQIPVLQKVILQVRHEKAYPVRQQQAGVRHVSLPPSSKKGCKCDEETAHTIGLWSAIPPVSM